MPTMARPAVDDGNNSVPANVPLLPPDSTLEQEQQRQPEAGQPQPQQQQQPSFMQTLMRLELVLILLVTFLAALSASGGVGVVPNTIADRYARLHHNYTGPDCGSIVDTVKPEACQAGTDDAQIAATWSQVGVSIFGLLVNPVVGSWSDVLGRRIPIMISFLVGSLSAFLFFCTIVTPRMDPIWYYLSFSLAGGFQYLGLVFAALSDLVPEVHRTGCFGVMIAMAYGGFAIGPSVPLFLNHKQTALFSAVLSITNVVIAALFFPETLSMDIRYSNRQRRQAEFAASSDDSTESTWMNVSHRTCSSILEPIRDMAVVNRDWSTRLIAVGTVISSMIFASDATLVIYYIQQHFDVDDGDIASMFLSLGIVGLLLQGSLQPLAKALGEANLLIITFVCGSLHNLLYGLAKSKQTIFVAIVLSQVTKLNLPVLSSLGSKQVSETVQGRIQGALSACGSMGAALGPLSMEFVYHHTKNKSRFGPGFMFVYASALYMFGAFMMALIPRTINRPHNIGDACSGTETAAHAPTRSGEDSAREEENDTAANTLRTVNSDLEEPLLEQHD